jgi:hypothetical protein
LKRCNSESTQCTEKFKNAQPTPNKSTQKNPKETNKKPQKDNPPTTNPIGNQGFRPPTIQLVWKDAAPTHLYDSQKFTNNLFQLGGRKTGICDRYLVALNAGHEICWVKLKNCFYQWVFTRNGKL